MCLRKAGIASKRRWLGAWVFVLELIIDVRLLDFVCEHLVTRRVNLSRWYGLNLRACVGTVGSR
jgi:hypothetical protein